MDDDSIHYEINKRCVKEHSFAVLGPLDIIRSASSTEPSRMPPVFISYSSRDQSFVEQLAADLKANNVDVWFDKWEILPGDSLIQKIGDAILENDYFIVVLSPDSVGSEWVTRDLSLALNREFEQRKVSVIPLLLQRFRSPRVP